MDVLDRATARHLSNAAKYGVALPVGESPRHDALALSALRPGDRACIVGIDPPALADDADLVLRLIEIGFVPGETLRVVAAAHPGADPLAVRIGSTTFALRGYEARHVRVLRIAP